MQEDAINFGRELQDGSLPALHAGVRACWDHLFCEVGQLTGLETEGFSALHVDAQFVVDVGLRAVALFGRRRLL